MKETTPLPDSHWQNMVLEKGLRVRDVPPHVITPAFLASRNASGRLTVGHHAAMRGDLAVIPEEMRTVDFFSMTGEPPVGHPEHAAFMADKKAGREEYVTSVGYAAVQKTGLNDIPLAAQTEAFFSLPGYTTDTVAHLSAREGLLPMMPRALKTPAFFAKGERSSVAHAAAAGRHLDQIPPDCITTKLLELQEHDGAGNLGPSVAHYAAKSGQLADLPPSLISNDLLKLKDHKGTSVRDSMHPEAAKKIEKSIALTALDYIKGIGKNLAPSFG